MMLLTTEQPNKATSTNQEHAFPLPVVAYPHQPFNNVIYLTPSPYLPAFFAYPPPQDANHHENSQNGVLAPAPYMISFPPPGIVYAFPHFHGEVLLGGPVSAPPALTKPKRKQVKMACTNCAEACKRCDEGRPCERCQKYGIGDSCRDGQRKQRKKGIKRVPYKRKNKNGDCEWTPAQAAPDVNAPIPAAKFPSPEGYSIYYPKPGTFLPHPVHEIPSGQEGSNGQSPIMPSFLPTYPHYPGPSTFVPHPGHEIPSGQKGSRGQPLIAPAAAENALPVLPFLSPEGGTFIPHPGHEILAWQKESNGQPPTMPYLLSEHSPYDPLYEYALCSGMELLGAQASPA